MNTSCEEGIKESGVLSTKDPLAWNWDIIRALLKNEGEALKRGTESSRRTLVRRVAGFITPPGGGYARTELSGQGSKFTLAALDLVSTLLTAPQDSDGWRLLGELLTGLKTCLVEISALKSAHDALLCPSNVTNSLCQDYFLLIGHMTRSESGRRVLDKFSFYQILTDLVASTNHDCYVKLVISTLDYSSDLAARKVLSKALESKSASCRLYATRFLHSMLRIGVSREGTLLSFIMGHIVDQLHDEDRTVAATALSTLQEACDSKDYVEAVIEERPCLLRLGDHGLLLLVRCLSSPAGFKALHAANFVESQLAKWATHFNYRYVGIVEGLLCDILVSPPSDRGRAATCSKEALLPSHLYQQLASHKQGLALLLADPNIPKLVQVLDSDPTSDEEMLETKAALYALSGVAFALDPSVLASMMHLATRSQIYSIRATAYYALCNVATTAPGVRKLHTLGWYAVRHDRHERCPTVAPLRHSLYDSHSPLNQTPTSNLSDSNSEGCKSGLFHLPEDSVLETDTEEYFWGIPGGKTHRVRERKSATLPYSSGTPAFYHNRSYSESKAETSETSDYRYDLGVGRKSRSNSYTDSSTSGDSSYGNRHYSAGERVSRLSPIPSARCLVPMMRNPRRPSLISNFSRTGSLRGSRQSVLKSLPQPSVFPPGLITYGELHQLSPVARQRPTEMEYGAPSSVDTTEADFSVIEGGTDKWAESSLQEPDESSESGGSEDVVACYLGLCLPAQLAALLPKEEPNLINNHVAFVSENLNVQGLEGLKNPTFHKEICFLGSRGLHNTMISTSESEGGYMIEGDQVGLEKETLPDNSAESSITDVPNIVERPMPIIFKSPIVIRSEISRMVEQLSNPILHKTCKQSLLQIKQAHGSLFEDVCVFSDVCHILSTCHVRIASRELIHELFDSNFAQIWRDAQHFLEEATSRLKHRLDTRTQLRKF